MNSFLGLTNWLECFLYIHLRDKHFMNMSLEQFDIMFGPYGLRESLAEEELGVENVKQTVKEPTKQRANDFQIAGVHYKNMRVQPWDVIDGLPHAQAIGFYRGNAIKYIMRAGEKGPAKEDYEKAIHYLQKLIETL